MGWGDRQRPRGGTLRSLTRKHLMEEAWATPPSSEHHSPTQLEPRSSSASAEMTRVRKCTHRCVFVCARVCVCVCGSTAAGSPPVCSAELLLGSHLRGHSPHPRPGLGGCGAGVACPGSLAVSVLGDWHLALSAHKHLLHSCHI